MEKRIKWIIIYLIINLFFIILPQSEKNQEMRMIIENTEKVNINTEFRGIDSNEFINLVENILIKYPKLENDYIYSIEEKDYIDIYKLELQVIGDRNKTNSLISDICKLNGIEIIDINSCKNEKTYETNITLIASRGNYE
ncbi:MAG: hypothetical protein ACRC76_06315 [Proteocatella sp.]